ncbi:MAG: hypothetical protein QM681_23665 [Novosphingobium sp.]
MAILANRRQDRCEPFSAVIPACLEALLQGDGAYAAVVSPAGRFDRRERRRAANGNECFSRTLCRTAFRLE